MKALSVHIQKFVLVLTAVILSKIICFEPNSFMHIYVQCVYIV